MAISTGSEGFRWFFAKVVNVDSDPKKIGRVKIRVFGVHPIVEESDENYAELNDDSILPWATIINSPTSAGLNRGGGRGLSPTGLLVGSIVFGFFADGNEGQLPMILGTIAGSNAEDIIAGEAEFNDVSELVRNSRGGTHGQTTCTPKDRIGSPQIGDISVSEPTTAYEARYPFNKAYVSEVGHVIEIDDTPQHERLHLYHKTGTYIEIDQTGRRVDKIVGNNYVIVANSNQIYVKGVCNIVVEGHVNIHTAQNMSLYAQRNIEISGNTVSITARGSGGVTIGAPNGNIGLGAKQIHLNSAGAASTTRSTTANNSTLKIGGTSNTPGGTGIPITLAGTDVPSASTNERGENLFSDAKVGTIGGVRDPNKGRYAGYISPELRGRPEIA